MLDADQFRFRLNRRPDHFSAELNRDFLESLRSGRLWYHRATAGLGGPARQFAVQRFP